jgi:hypothetical protein
MFENIESFKLRLTIIRSILRATQGDAAEDGLQKG